MVLKPGICFYRSIMLMGVEELGEYVFIKPRCSTVIKFPFGRVLMSTIPLEPLLIG